MLISTTSAIRRSPTTTSRAWRWRPSLAAALARAAERGYTYRFLFVPGTIGAIAWLARNERPRRPHQARPRARPASATPAAAPTSAAGAATPRSTAPSRTCCAARGGDHDGPRLLALRLRRAAVLLAGLRPAGRLLHARRRTAATRSTTPPADNLDFVAPRALADSLRRCCARSSDRRRQPHLREPQPYGEPQLGRRGLYRPAAAKDESVDELALLWVLNLSDARTPCSTSPSVPAWRSRRCRLRPGCSRMPDCSRRCRNEGACHRQRGLYRVPAGSVPGRVRPRGGRPRRRASTRRVGSTTTDRRASRR